MGQSPVPVHPEQCPQGICLKTLFWQCLRLQPFGKYLPTNNDYFQYYYSSFHLGSFWHDYCDDTLHSLYNFLLVSLLQASWLGGNLSLGLFLATTSKTDSGSCSLDCCLLVLKENQPKFLNSAQYYYQLDPWRWFFFTSFIQGVLNIESSVAFWKTESRLHQTAVSPASHTTDERQLLGLIWLFQARVITTYVCVSFRMFLWQNESEFLCVLR